MTPADVTLIESLDFSIKSGDHLLIAGPNGLENLHYLECLEDYGQSKKV